MIPNFNNLNNYQTKFPTQHQQLPTPPDRFNYSIPPHQLPVNNLNCNKNNSILPPIDILTGNPQFNNVQPPSQAHQQYHYNNQYRYQYSQSQPIHNQPQQHFVPTNNQQITSPISPITSPYKSVNNSQQQQSIPTNPYFPTNISKPISPKQQKRKKMNNQNQDLLNPTSPKKVKKSSKSKKTDLMITKFSSKINNNDTKTPPTSVTTTPKPKKSKNNIALITNKQIYYPIHKLTEAEMTTIPQDQLSKVQQIYPQIEIKKYSTSAIDPNRTYLTAYEYKLNDQWVVWDFETGFVHLTGIWKASLQNNSESSTSSMKADIVKLSESTPKEFQPYIKRIRGGFLKIQGTWLPFKLCKILARRFCYNIRYELIPIFGKQFPDLCLKPGEPGFGELKLDDLAKFNQDELPIPKPVVEEEVKSEPDKRKSNSTVTIPPIGTFIQPQPINLNSPVLNKKLSIDPITPPSNSNNRPHRKSGSSSTVSSVSSNQKTPVSATDDLSINDSDEIVNASKCLQSLSKLKQSTTKTVDQDFYDETELTDYESNYPFSPITRQEEKDKNGISSILYAANLKAQEQEQHKNESETKRQPTNTRPSMRINDLLT
ncbi:unnamed protein product [Candida verbasci]|uniref:HTH APSES-type domain-containing protein n=1 Tax=Candida verbasci TaxID=1227364 RepID=A0A9W4XF88_9ASCO|nr:unnamed protein product [Candida verbasci]